MKRRLIITVLCALGLLGPTAVGGETPGPVLVTVVDPGGAPVVGARVSIRAESGCSRWWAPKRRALAVTCAQGVARLQGLTQGTKASLVVTAPDGRWRELADAWRDDWTPAATTIRMERARVLKGVVRGPSRKGVPYAIVHCEVGSWGGQQSSAADGTFVFENLPSGNAALHAELDNPEGMSATGPKVRCAIDGRDVELALPQAPDRPKPCLLVRITTPGGRPVVAAEGSTHGEWTERSGGGISHSSYSGSAQVQGCAVRLYESRGGLTLVLAGARTELGERLPYGPVRTGRLGTPPGEIEVRLTEGLTIEGRVLDARGVGAVGVEVQAMPARATQIAKGSTSWSSTAHGFGVTGADGTFLVEGLEKRNYRLVALPTHRFLSSTMGVNVAAGPRFPIEAAQDEPQAVGVPAAAGARGVVVYVRNAATPTVTVVGDDGKPLAGALVKVLTIPTEDWHQPGPAWPEQRTGAKGAACFEGLDPELYYELQVEPPRNQADLIPWIVKQWRPGDVRITLGKPRTIAGVVQTPDGIPIPEANLRYEMSNGPQDARGEGKAGPDGRFEWKGLRPGDYVVHAWPPDGFLGGTQTGPEVQGSAHTIRAGDEAVVLPVGMPTTLEVQLPGWSKKLGSVKARLVCVAESDPVTVEQKIPKSGLLTFDGLDWRKRYLLWVGPLKDGRNAYRNPAHPVFGTLVVPMRAGHVVSGRIAAPRGTKSKKVYVVYPGFEIKGKVDARGRFTIDGLPPGPWTLRATGKQGKKMLEVTVEVQRGEEAKIQLSKQ